MASQLTRRLDSNFDMTFGSGLQNYAADAEAVAQNIRVKFQFLLGEWFLDTTYGIPYLQNFVVPPPDLAFVEATLKQAALEEFGVQEIDGFQISFDHSTRVCTVFVSVVTVYGTSVSIQVTQ